jgi:hypothetical protein
MKIKVNWFHPVIPDSLGWSTVPHGTFPLPWHFQPMDGAASAVLELCPVGPKVPESRVWAMDCIVDYWEYGVAKILCLHASLEAWVSFIHGWHLGLCSQGRGLYPMVVLRLVDLSSFENLPLYYLPEEYWEVELFYWNPSSTIWKFTHLPHKSLIL